jgi:hypothetical protein
MGDSRSTSSRPTIMTDDTDYEEMYEMFSTSFRGLRNRNRFVRHVFLLLGGQMCFSFIVYFLLVYEYMNLFQRTSPNPSSLFSGGESPNNSPTT